MKNAFIDAHGSCSLLVARAQVKVDVVQRAHVSKPGARLTTPRSRNAARGVRSRVDTEGRVRPARQIASSKTSFLAMQFFVYEDDLRPLNARLVARTKKASHGLLDDKRKDA